MNEHVDSETVDRDGDGAIASEYLDEFDLEEACRRDPNGARRRMVLLGAGASVEAGLPAAVALHAELLSNVKVYGLVARALRSDDVEQILRLLGTIAEAGEKGSLGSDLNAVNGFERINRVFGVSSAREASQNAADAVNLVLDHVRSHYWMADEDHVRAEYLRPLIEAQRGGTVATLNYDNSLLAVGGADWNYWEQDVEIPAEHPWRTRLLPLHGALEWEHRSDRVHQLDRIVKRPEWQDPGDLSFPYRPGIVLGAGNKLRSYGPFLSLLHEFETALSQARTLIALGYSWRDNHITDLIRKWVTSDARIRREDLANERMPDTFGRIRLIVGTGPDSGRVSPAVEQIRLHHADDVEVKPVRGPASEVIQNLFSPGGEFAEPHLGRDKMPWCSA